MDMIETFCKRGDRAKVAWRRPEAVPAGTAVAGPDGVLVDDGDRRWWCRGSGLWPADRAPADVADVLDARQSELSEHWGAY